MVNKKRNVECGDDIELMQGVVYLDSSADEQYVIHSWDIHCCKKLPNVHVCAQQEMSVNILDSRLADECKK
jgi:hypothetical protein